MVWWGRQTVTMCDKAMSKAVGAQGDPDPTWWGQPQEGIESYQGGLLERG